MRCKIHQNILGAGGCLQCKKEGEDLLTEAADFLQRLLDEGRIIETHRQPNIEKNKAKALIEKLRGA